MSTIFPIRLNDPLVMHGWGLSVHRPHDVAMQVFVSLLLNDSNGMVRAISILSPEQARDLALNLLKMADEADLETRERIAAIVT